MALVARTNEQTYESLNFVILICSFKAMIFDDFIAQQKKNKKK